MALAAALTGCAGRQPFEGRADYAKRLADEAGWTRQRIPAGGFVLTGYAKGLETAGGDLVVYLESDGFAWASRRAVSADPTPRNPQGLKLALRDPRRRVLYLARPCQYAGQEKVGCDPVYWTSRRYGEAVIAALDRAIDEVRAGTGATRIELIGVSGGGVVAALVAARREDVVRLTTVAANLDHEAWTRHHGVSPLTGSLNPADYAERLQAIPQTHYVGEDDEIVPPAVVESYLGRMTDRSRTRLVVMPDFDHDCCWVGAWPDLLAQ